jgi:branched-chain amino acid transport system ATP-binding protein
MLEVKGVNSAYGRAHILYDLSLSANRGEAVVLLGRNGCNHHAEDPHRPGAAAAGDSFDGRRMSSSNRTDRPPGLATPEDRRIFTDLSVMEN